MPVSEAIMRAALAALYALPKPLQRRLAGKPVEIDGNPLYTEVQLALRVLNALPNGDYGSVPLAELRTQLDSEARVFGALFPVHKIEDISIPTRGDKSVPARVYRHRPDTPLLGSVVYFHGGGWVLGSLDSCDTICRFIAHHLNVAVISVDYRLAPEHPFPAAVDDAIDAYRWVRAQPQWGEVVAVSGDSAGGTLSAVISNETRLDNPPDAQILYFPATDLTSETASYDKFAEGYFLTKDQMYWYRDKYVTKEQLSDPRVSPALADLGDGKGLPPAHVAVAGYDVLRDEGIAYARKLEALGVPTTLQIATGHIHAFTNATGIGNEGKKAFLESVEAMRALLERARAARV